jgi:hypothetical protein
MRFRLYCLLIIFLLGCSKLAFGEDVIQLEIVRPSIKGQLIEAKIQNLSDKAKDLGFGEVLVYGKRKPIKHSKMVEVSWYKISLKNKNYNLKKPLKSRFNSTDKFVQKDVFKARGNRKFLAKEIEDLFNSQNPDLRVLVKESSKDSSPINSNQAENNQVQAEDATKPDDKSSQNNQETKSPSEIATIPTDVELKSENCKDNEFTHDFATGKSYRNKTIYYLDANKEKVDVAICKKSEEVFIHRQDSGGSCPIINDVAANQIIAQSRKYIMVDGAKKYIGPCNSSPYKEIGYKWKQEFYDPSASILADDAKDNIYIGSNQGEELEDSKYEGATYLSRPYNIESYNKSDKCNDWNSISYNNIEIDLSKSDKASIKLDNYLDYRQELPKTAKRCVIIAADNSCNKWKNIGFTQNSISYYQRCINHRCPLSKVSKTPIYQRIDGTKFYDEEQKRESKYTCGTNLDGSEYYYNVKN